MKIIAVDSSTKRPLANISIQLQIKGKNSGFITVKTDQNGHFQLDEEYMGHQLLATIGGTQPGGGAGQGPWVTATEGVTLLVPNKQKTTTGSQK